MVRQAASEEQVPRSSSSSSAPPATSSSSSPKFRRHADPSGNPPLGFRRVDGFLEVDPDSIGHVVEIFRTYSAGDVSLPELERMSGVDHEALKIMLRNPIYDGWVRRHHRSSDGQRLPAAWRDAPPVDDALWERVQSVREDRYTGGGRSTRRHVHVLAGKVFCVCGTRIRSEVRAHKRWTHRHYRHPDRCAAWITNTRMARVFEEPLCAQVEQMRLSDSLMVNLRRLAAVSAPTPDATNLRRRRIERELAGLAQRHATRSIATNTYLAEHQRLTGLLDAVTDEPAGAAIADPGVAIGWLKDMRRLWRSMDDEGRRNLASAIYERVTVTSEGIVEVELTPEARGSTGTAREGSAGAPGGERTTTHHPQATHQGPPSLAQAGANRVSARANLREKALACFTAERLTAIDQRVHAEPSAC